MNRRIELSELIIAISCEHLSGNGMSGNGLSGNGNNFNNVDFQKIFEKEIANFKR